MGFYRNFLQRFEAQLKTSERFSTSGAAKKGQHVKQTFRDWNSRNSGSGPSSTSNPNEFL